MIKIDSQKFMLRSLRVEWIEKKEVHENNLCLNYQNTFRKGFDESQEYWKKVQENNPFKTFEEWLKEQNLQQDE